MRAGGRTGLTSVVAGLLFLPFLFLAPLLSLVPALAIAPVLVLAGAFMLKPLIHVRWERFDIGLLHYTSDVPYSVRASLLSRRLGLTGLEAAFAGALAILKFILEEAQRSGGSGDAEAAR